MVIIAQSSKEGASPSLRNDLTNDIVGDGADQALTQAFTIKLLFFKDLIKFAIDKLF